MEGRSRAGLVGARRVLAFLALFSGIALLLNILFSVDLRLGLGFMTVGLAAGFGLTLRHAGVDGRRVIWRTLGYGVVAGIVATLVYDVARTILSMIDGSPYTPFEAIVRFGQMLLGSPARDGAVILAGALFHALNGAAFGVSFTFAFVRNGAISLRRVFLLGMGWGLFLEAFQMTLYPDWLGIRYLNEFLTISAFGHLAYGATLGPVARWLLRRTWKEDDLDAG